MLKRKAAFLVLAVTLIGLMGLGVACGSADSPSADGDEGAATGQAVVTSHTPAETVGVIGFRMQDIDGELHRIGVGASYRAAVIVLLDPGCPISNRYAPELNDVAGFAEEHGLMFYGVLSDPLVTPAEARAFRDEFGLAFTILFDAAGDLAAALSPSHVPQAFVVGKDDALAYAGRIDNRFEAPGRPRQRITSHDLRDAVEAVGAGRVVETPRTEPVGCVFEAWGDSGGGLPEQVTYHRDIAPMLAANCVECHRPDAVAPFSLETYTQARRRGGMSLAVVEDGLMPPWRADPSYSHFRDERYLTDRQKALLAAWVEAGKPEGDVDHALPAPPAPAPGWRLGEPDVELTMPEPFDIPAQGEDIYRRFVIPGAIREDSIVVAVDFKPGDASVVHHYNLFVDYGGGAREKDAADPGPGFDVFGEDGSMQQTAEWETDGFGIGGGAPGSDAFRLPEGLGMYLPAGGDLVIEIHYHLSGKATQDQSTVALYYADGEVTRFTDGLLIGSQDLDIPAGEANYWRHIYMDVPVDMNLIDIFPHMHYVGAEVLARAALPDGDIVPLVRIPAWDLRWQNFYMFREPIRLPAGSRIDAWFRFDNSASNPANPHSPPEDLKWGWESSDEMLEIWMTVEYEGERHNQRLQEAALATWYREAGGDAPPGE